jgi:hypothetical protein
MRKLLLALYMLAYAPIAWGYTPSAGLRILEPSLLTMEYYKIANNRDEYLAINDKGSTKYGPAEGEAWSYGSAVRFNLELIKYGEYGLYWDNHVHMAATQCCVRHVGWEFEWGAHVSRHLDFFYYHHSEHIMDVERPARRYPLVNQYGVRFIFIQEGRK